MNTLECYIKSLFKVSLYNIENFEFRKINDENDPNLIGHLYYTSEEFGPIVIASKYKHPDKWKILFYDIFGEYEDSCECGEPGDFEFKFFDILKERLLYDVDNVDDTENTSYIEDELYDEEDDED